MRLCKFLLIGILLTIVFHVNSQTVWAPSGATWYYSYTPQVASSAGFIRIKYVRDSLVAGKMCKVLEQQTINNSVNTPGNDTSYIYWYTFSSGDSVFYYDQLANQFFLLYDFSGQQNDIWQVGDSSAFCSPWGASAVQIDSVGVENISGFSLRRKSVSLAPNSYKGYSGKIIERIGNHNGFMFPTVLSCIVLHVDIYFRCYSDDTFGHYQKAGSPDCDFITGLEESSSFASQNIKLYPNPATEELNIDLGNDEISDVFLFDSSGKKVFNISVEQNSIEVSALPRGVYLLQVISKKGVVYHAKFMR